MQQRSKYISEFFIVISLAHCEQNRVSQLMVKGLLSHLFGHTGTNDDLLSGWIAQAILSDAI